MKRPAGALLAVACGTFLVTFDGAAVQLALPALQRELGHPVHAVQWVMTAFLLVSTAALLPAGRLGDLYGRDRTWRLGVGVFALASAGCTLAPGLGWLIATRSLQGLGAALATANAAPLLLEAFPRSQRGRALAAGNVAIALGLVAGPPVGALLVDALSWRLLFALAVPLGAAAWWGSRRVLPPSLRLREPLGLPSAALATAGLAALLVAGTFGRRWGWASAATLVSFGAGLVCLVGFGGSLRGPRPLLDVRLFSRRLFVSGALASFLGFAALFAMTVAMPYFLVVAQGRRLMAAGLLVGAVPVGLCIAAPIAGWIYDRVGSRALCTVGLLAVAGALVLVALCGARTGAFPLLGGMALAGAGLGAFEAPNDGAVLGSLPSERLGVGTATLGALRNLGMTIGVALAGTLLDFEMARADGSPADRAAAGVRLALLTAAVLAVGGAVAAALRPAGDRARSPATRRPRRMRRRSERSAYASARSSS